MAVGGESRADDAPKLSGTMQCDRAVEPGRVRCSVEARVMDGRSIAWADVTIVELPDFTSALKGRIGRLDAISREPASHRWAFGLVARRAGEGDAHARVRAVVCEESARGSAARCAPVTLELRAKVVVG